MVAGSPSMAISRRIDRNQQIGRGPLMKEPLMCTSAVKHTSHSIRNKVTSKKECIGDSSSLDQTSLLALPQTSSSLTDIQYGKLDDDDASRSTIEGSMDSMGTITILYQADLSDQSQHTRRLTLNEKVEIFFVPHPCSSLCPSSESSEERDPPLDANRDRPQPQPQPRSAPLSTITSHRFVKNSIGGSCRPPLHKNRHVSLIHDAKMTRGKIPRKANKWEKIETDTRHGVPCEIVIKQLKDQGVNRNTHHSQSNKKDAAPRQRIQNSLYNSSTIDLTKRRTVSTKKRIDVEQNRRKAYTKSHDESRFKSSKDVPDPHILRQVINKYHTAFHNRKTLYQDASRNIKKKSLEKKNGLPCIKNSEWQCENKEKIKAKAEIKHKISQRSIVEILKKANAADSHQRSHQMPSMINGVSTNKLSRKNSCSRPGHKTPMRRLGKNATQIRSSTPCNNEKSNIQIRHKVEFYRSCPKSCMRNQEEGITRRLATSRSKTQSRIQTEDISARYGGSKSSNQASLNRYDRGMSNRVKSIISTRRLNEEVSLTNYTAKKRSSHHPRQVVAKKHKSRSSVLTRKKVTFLKLGSKLNPIVEGVPCNFL